MDQVSFMRSRPQLPGMTQVALSGTKKSAYASRSIETSLAAALATDGVNTEFTENGKSELKQSAQVRAARKLISKLPFELRESMGTAFDAILQQAEIAKKESHVLKVEVLTLQDEVSSKSTDYFSLERNAEVYRQKISALENKLDEMKDNMDSRQKYLVKNRRSLDRMAATNRM
jgi:predicted component of type VI protein secretion system